MTGVHAVPCTPPRSDPTDAHCDCWVLAAACWCAANPTEAEFEAAQEAGKDPGSCPSNPT